MPPSNHIIFFDTTLRDGEQSPGCTMHHDEKLRMAHQIADLGGRKAVHSVLVLDRALAPA